MITAAALRRHASKAAYLLRLPSNLYLRNVSTNQAISKGLRKSSAARARSVGDSRPPARQDRNAAKLESRGTSPPRTGYAARERDGLQEGREKLRAAAGRARRLGVPPRVAKAFEKRASTFDSSKPVSSSGYRQGRSTFAKREDRPAFGDRENRSTFGRREDRPAFGDRRGRASSGYPAEKPESRERRERLSFEDREKGEFGGRGERPTHQDRRDKTFYGDRSAKSAFAEVAERRHPGAYESLEPRQEHRESFKDRSIREYHESRRDAFESNDADTDGMRPRKSFSAAREDRSSRTSDRDRLSNTRGARSARTQQDVGDVDADLDELWNPWVRRAGREDRGSDFRADSGRRQDSGDLKNTREDRPRRSTVHFSEPEDIGEAFEKRNNGRSFDRKLSSAGYGSLPRPGFSERSNPSDNYEYSLRDRTPISIPHTTAASEFLYGTSATRAALIARRRKLYKLYLHRRGIKDGEAGADIKSLGSRAGVDIKLVDDEYLPVMDKMSDGRPHNGCVLETSPLPRLPIQSLGRALLETSEFQVALTHQSAEEKAVNGTDTAVPYSSQGWRYPFVLLLDGIVDPGNMGAILRTAYYLGVDAVAISKRTSAPLSPVALKAAAGAAEAVRLFSVDSPSAFVHNSKQYGWKVWAAIAPVSSLRRSEPRTSSRQVTNISTSSLKRRQSPLVHHPCLLMLGGEGAGLIGPLQKAADNNVYIEPRKSGPDVGVDSLNVSVAAGLLCDTFLRKPRNEDLVGNKTYDQNDDGPEEQDDKKNKAADEEGDFGF